MSDNIRVFQGGGDPAHIVAGRLAEEIKELVYSYAGQMPVSTAIGALEIAKLEIVSEQD